MPVIDFYLGRLTSDAVLSAIGGSDSKLSNKRLCEANFYLAEWHALQGSATGARPLLNAAKRDCPRTFVQYHGSARA